MSAPAATSPTPFSDTTRQLIRSHTHNLEYEIDSLLDEERKVMAYTVARLAAAQYPAATRVIIRDLCIGDAVACDVDGNEKKLSVDADIAPSLIAMLHRLPTGDSSAWERHLDTIELDVVAALDFSDQYPFQQVQDRIVAYIEEKTGRTVRRVEITSELWDNGYFYDDTVAVDYADGDSDEILIADMFEFSGELRHEGGDPGPSTVVTIVRTNTGISIR